MADVDPPPDPAPPAQEPVRRGGRPPGLSERVRRDVHAAVRSLLVQVGYAALGMEDVAAAAGVHKSTLYRQWTSKAQLVRDVLAASEMAALPRPDEGSWDADLDRLCDGLRRLFNDATTIALIRTRVNADDPELAEGLRQVAMRDMTFVQLPFERAMRRGEISPDADVPMLTECLLSALVTRAGVTGLPIDSAFMRRLANVIRAAAGTVPADADAAPSAARSR
jgi:AcrR family transcriptional regulator